MSAFFPLWPLGVWVLLREHKTGTAQTHRSQFCERVFSRGKHTGLVTRGVKPGSPPSRAHVGRSFHAGRNEQGVAPRRFLWLFGVMWVCPFFSGPPKLACSGVPLSFPLKTNEKGKETDAYVDLVKRISTPEFTLQGVAADIFTCPLPGKSCGLQVLCTFRVG